MTRIVPVHSADDPAIYEAARLLREGELVAFPTETVYGLGANALNAEAVAKIFAAKGRPSTDPLIVHVSDLDMLRRVPFDLPSAAEGLAALWPAPLTLIVKRPSAVPTLVSAGLDTVGLRMPDHPIALALIRAAGVPIAAPSANRFAHTSPTSAQHVYDDLNGSIAMILDAGVTAVGIESSIVDVTSDPPRLLRPGGLSLETIRTYLPDIQVMERHSDASDEAMTAPGMLLKHYSPDAPLILFEGDNYSVREAIRLEADRNLTEGVSVGILAAEEDRAALDLPDVHFIALGSLTDLATIAQRLYASLREMEQAQVDIILARAFPTKGHGLAIRDRLLRAAAGNVIQV